MSAAPMPELFVSARCQCTFLRCDTMSLNAVDVDYELLQTVLEGYTWSRRRRDRTSSSCSSAMAEPAIADNEPISRD